MNISNEVASLESRLESSTAENQMLKHTNVRLECENTQLRNTVGKLEAELGSFRDCVAELEAILNHAGIAIMHGVNNYRAKKRSRQEENLIDPNDKPLFLTEQQAAE